MKYDGNFTDAFCEGEFEGVSITELPPNKDFAKTRAKFLSD